MHKDYLFLFSSTISSQQTMGKRYEKYPHITVILLVFATKKLKENASFFDNKKKLTSLDLLLDALLKFILGAETFHVSVLSLPGLSLSFVPCKMQL